jgi:phosphoribosylaminoimidazolecarboxamide formyltransferase / IMP cyclohydrolase
LDRLPIRRAILSVTDKTGLSELARFLRGGGVELVSTGGTKRMLEASGIAVTSVSEVTGFPEILGGRVKTLHPHIHASILADKDDPDHLNTLSRLGLLPFDLVCVNLYDFAKAVAQGLDLREAVEQIDIGGPTLLRASAKNFHSIAVVPDPAFYPQVMSELSGQEFTLGLELRRKLAAFVFSATAKYDSMIAEYLSRPVSREEPEP